MLLPIYSAVVRIWQSGSRTTLTTRTITFSSSCSIDRQLKFAACYGCSA